MSGRLRPLRLLPGAPWWAEALAGGGAVALLAWSRFALLASGPWEWDETLFARGLMRFELAAHFPHPPGFPGWLALGHLVLTLGRCEPLRALQLASAALSVLTLWPLAALGRRAAPAPVALAGALLALLAPGPWLHAVRGFSSTPAAFFLLAAAWGATAARPRPTPVTLLVAAAVLVRPQLLPAAAVLWLAFALRVGRVRPLVPGVVAAMALGVVAVAAMAHAEGGLGPMLDAFADHAARHFSRLGRNPGGLADLGIVKSFGGVAGAAPVAVLAVAGLLAWTRRRSPREAAAAAAVVAALLAEVTLAQNRTYPRYAVPVALAAAPLAAAGAAAVAPAGVAAAGVAALAAWQAATAYPLLVEQHESLLPGWAAVDRAYALARRHGLDVIVEAGLHPFASYRWYVAGGGRPPARPRLLLSPWAPEPWAGVVRPYVVATDVPHRYLAPLARGRLRWHGVSPRLEPLTQGRFLDAEVLVNPPLPLGTWWPAERGRHGERWMWGGRDAALVLPPLPQGTWLRLDLRPARGPAPLVVAVDGETVAVVPGDAGRTVVAVPPDRLAGRRPHTVAFHRAAAYPPGGRDTRPLAVQLFAARAVGPRVPWGGPVARRREREALGVRLLGAYLPERFPDAGWGVWLRPRAAVELPAGPGEVELVLAAPRPVPPRTVLRVGERILAGPLEVGPRPVRVPVTLLEGDTVAGRVELRLESVPYCPAEAGAGPDSRRLGVVLFAARFCPPREARAPWGW